MGGRGEQPVTVPLDVTLSHFCSACINTRGCSLQSDTLQVLNLGHWGAQCIGGFPGPVLGALPCHAR